MREDTGPGEASHVTPPYTATHSVLIAPLPVPVSPRVFGC